MDAMDTSGYELLHHEGETPIKGWVRGVPLEDQARAQLRNIASLPFVGPWVAVMPDVHLGIGATVGSVVPTQGAIIPAAVGVDIGCGMAAVRTTLNARDLPDSLARLRLAIERAIPVGFNDYRDPVDESNEWQGWSEFGELHRGVRQVGARPGVLVTKTLMFMGEGGNLSGDPGGPMFRAYDKTNGKVVWETDLPSLVSGAPMTYMLNGRPSGGLDALSGIDKGSVDRVLYYTLSEAQGRYGSSVRGPMIGAVTPVRFGSVRYCSTCHPIASPSRSSSVAMKISRAPLAIFFRSPRMSSFPSIVTYSGSKPCSMSIPSFFAGRSRTWPTVARTV